MSRILLLVFLGCTASHAELAKTPAATSPQRHVAAPPASSSDRERATAHQQMEDVDVSRRAYEEAQRAKHPRPEPKPRRL